ncbi:ribonuclease [Aurantiacibacter gilvus]|uniref:Ribonuclease n=1 Tax=Aurantiacibacter gilvus TaxID=3139141 RepID=A0ABU9IBI2_9SPHN
MVEWLVEHGIGEDRALLVENDRILAARHFLSGAPWAGTIYPARLVSRSGGSARGTARTEGGLEILVDKLPRDCTEGSELLVRLTRAPIAERSRLKLAQGRPVAADAPEDSSNWALREVSSFAPGAWEEVWHAASSGVIDFAGGQILCCVTPAMTVIDIDGDLQPRELALAAVPAIAQALHWFDIGGSVGIDFPTLEAKADRGAVNQALEDALADWPHERTAMNGFGFVQLVARLEGPSLLHKFDTSRVGMCARYALRIAERLDGHGGAVLLTVHPALRAKIQDEWLAELSRRTGRQVRIETDPGLALEAPSAQIVPL